MQQCLPEERVAGAGEPTDLLFQAIDPQGRSVGLARKTFETHIYGRHPGMSPDAIRAAVEDPDVIIENLDHGSINYLVRMGRGRYRMVAAKRHAHRNPDWEVATAYPRSIPPHGNLRVLWTRS